MTFLSTFTVSELFKVHPRTVIAWTTKSNYRYLPDFPVHWLEHPRRRIFVEEEILDYLEKHSESKRI